MFLLVFIIIPVYPVVNGCGEKRGQKMPLENVYCDPVTRRRSRQPLSRVAAAFSLRFCDTLQECVNVIDGA